MWTDLATEEEMKKMYERSNLDENGRAEFLDIDRLDILIEVWIPRFLQIKYLNDNIL